MPLPVFMLCENEQAELDGEYILHTHKPRFIAKRVHDDPKNDFKVVDDIDNMSAFFDNDMAKMTGLMRQMEDWYRSYQDYLDEQYGEEE